MWNQIVHSVSIMSNGKDIIYLQLNSERLSVVQLVGVNEIKFDTGKIALINTKDHLRLSLS